MTRTFDESSLSAFIDGELDALAMREVDDFLRQDANARQFVLNAVRGTAFLKAAYNATLHEQVPERLLRSVQSGPPVRDRFSGRRRTFWRAAAAVILTIIGFGAGIFGGSRMRVTEGPMPVAALVDRYSYVVDAALENNLSGAPREWRKPEEPVAVVVTPVRTYRDNNQRYYREYRMQVSSGKDLREIGGLAYRMTDGKWKTTALFF
jgi:hypothetical protein